MIDTIILMAGKGTRFLNDFPHPKPLIPLHDIPLVRWVVENLRFSEQQRFIFVCLEEHVEKFQLHDLFATWNINFEIVVAPTVTEGAACSAFLAKDIYLHHEILIANCDQFIIFSQEHFLNEARKGYDGFIMSMNANGNKWSYLKTDSKNLVTEVKEKLPISNIGTTGIYYFRSGILFNNAVTRMINCNDRYNNEFYLAPVYNYLIKENFKVGHFNIGTTGKEMIGLGTSEDFKLFESSPLSLKLKQKIFT